jgi:hypothetical protein
VISMSIAAASRKTAAPAPLVKPPAPAGTPYRFSVKQYDRMIELGILGPDDRAELIEGVIRTKMSRNPPHDGTLGIINTRLVRLLPDEWVLRNQSAVALARSEPEPDFAVVPGPDEKYLKRHPRAADVVLVIEVADSTRMSDRRYKGMLYAQAKIPEFWLVNLVEGCVEVYSQPKGGKSPAYSERRDYRKGESVPLILEGKELARLSVSDLCRLPA